MINGLTIPSYATGYAHNAGEAMYPHLHDGLVANYDMGLGATGLLARDTSGHQNLGTLTNMDPATDWVTTELGMALDFDFTDDYINVPKTASLKFPSAITITALVRAGTLSSTNRTIVGDRLGSVANYVLRMWNDVPNGKLAFFYWDAGTNLHFWASDDPVFVAGEWVAVAVTAESGADPILYKDGTEVPGAWIVGAGAAFVTNNNAVNIGNISSEASKEWRGPIGTVSLWNRALSPAEIALLHRDMHAVSRLRERSIWSVPAAGNPYYYRYMDRVRGHAA